MTGEIREFEFDDRNLRHLASHEIDANLVLDILTGEPVIAVNEPRHDRSGSHLMIGPSAMGRYWTIVIIEVDSEAGVWRPIRAGQAHRRSLSYGAAKTDRRGGGPTSGIR